MLMKAKLNFTSTVVGNHPNVLKFIGAVVEDHASESYIGPRDNSVQFVVDLYRGDRFLAATNHAVKMCIYSSIDYVLEFNLLISVSS